jgi:ribulose 1,5-bisphosphate carboxylase large subunit-like protein
MGYYVIYILTKERINNMSKEKMKQTIDTIKHLDSMKAVKVAFDLSESNQDSINKIMQIVHGNVNNINLLAERIAELEKKLGTYERSTN